VTNLSSKIQKPAKLTRDDWWQILKRVFAKIEKHNVTMLSAAVAFYAMLAVFPALGAIVSLYAMVADPTEVISHFNLLAKALPDDVTQIFNDQLLNITQVYSETLGFRFFVGLAFSLWSAHRGIHALTNAITIAYQEKESRNFIHLNLVSLGMTLGAVVIVVIALVIMLALPSIILFLPLTDWQVTLTTILSWLAFLATIVFSFNLLYRFAPPRRPAKWHWLSSGALLATTLCITGSIGFTLYVRYFGNYNEMYGTLGAFIVLLLWFYLTNFAVVLGAMLNAEMELQTSADTTVGKARPLGERGAYVADTPPPKSS